MSGRTPTYGLLGSITAVVDTSTGSVAAAYEYDAFGQRTQFAGTLFQHYGYTAREEDPESGLIYYRARHYDPAIGQFIQRDPIGFASGDLNIYAYVWNDPYNWTDPSGLVSTTSNSVQDRQNAAMAAAVTGAITRGVLNLAQQIMQQLLNASKGGDTTNTPNTPNTNTDDSTSSNTNATTPPPPPDPNQCGPQGPDNSFWERFKSAMRTIIVVGGSLFGDNPAEIGYQMSPSDEVVQTRIRDEDAENYKSDLDRARDAEQNGRSPDDPDC